MTSKFNAACAIAIGVAALCGSSAHAAVATDSPDAWLRANIGPSSGAAQTITGGDFSFLAWIRPTDVSAPESGFLTVTEGMEVHLLQGGAVRARLLGSAGATLSATAQSNLQPDEWTLIGISFKASTGRLDLWTVSESQSIKAASATSPGFTVGPASNVWIGSFDSAPAMLGTYGAAAFRDHAITQHDVSHLWVLRQHLAIYGLNNLSLGGSMSGSDGCIHMINHAVTTNPINLALGTTEQAAAVVGEPATVHNFHIFNRAGASGTSLRAVRFLSNAEDFTYVSVYDPPTDGFFVRPLPALNQPLALPHYVPGPAPLLRTLATGPEGVLRVMTSANSRSIQASDSSPEGTGNYAHGFIALNMEKTSGILNRTAYPGDNMPWFGFDAGEHAPYTSGPMEPIWFRNFSRFWTGSYSPGSRGPGEGTHLAPPGSSGSATFIMRAKPDGLMHADQPLLMQAYVLRFPGASDVTWAPNLHSRQGEPGTDTGPETTISLDTQTWTHTLSAANGDSVAPAGFRITLGGNHTDMVSVNDAIQFGSCITVVSAVTYSAANNNTRIDVEHAFSTLPQMGDLLRFGSWGFEVIEYEWPPANPASENVWRGLRISTTGQGGAGKGVVLFGFSAWRPNVDNAYIFGTAGWAGRGYSWQVNRSFSGPLHGWMQILAPDVWLQMFAQQNSEPQHMSAYADAIKSAIPGVEIAWLGDFEHETGGTYEAWHHYILQNAKADGVIAATVLKDERFGSYKATLDGGLRSDGDHINARGNKRLAEVWTEMLQFAAQPDDPGEPGIPGDINGDGVVNVHDLLLLVAAWGPCPDQGPCPADVNGDGVVDVLDLLLLIGNWTF